MKRERRASASAPSPNVRTSDNDHGTYAAELVWLDAIVQGYRDGQISRLGLLRLFADVMIDLEPSGMLAAQVLDFADMVKSRPWLH
jgi:hypothetical protein